MTGHYHGQNFQINLKNALPAIEEELQSKMSILIFATPRIREPGAEYRNIALLSTKFPIFCMHQKFSGVLSLLAAAPVSQIWQAACQGRYHKLKQIPVSTRVNIPVCQV